MFVISCSSMISTKTKQASKATEQPLTIKKPKIGHLDNQVRAFLQPLYLNPWFRHWSSVPNRLEEKVDPWQWCGGLYQFWRWKICSSGSKETRNCPWVQRWTAIVCVYIQRCCSQKAGKILVDIREFYGKDKEDEKPGKKGISLNADQVSPPFVSLSCPK